MHLKIHVYKTMLAILQKYIGIFIKDTGIVAYGGEGNGNRVQR